MPKGEVFFDYERCKGCQLCVAFCPVKILTQDTVTLNRQGYNVIRVTDKEKCIGCASCAIVCPDSVITVRMVDHA